MSILLPRFSNPNPQSFYSKSLHAKLYPFIGNGEALMLGDAIRLLELSGRAAWWTSQADQPMTIGEALSRIEPHERVDIMGTDGFETKDEYLAISLTLPEWLALAHWSSELAECRLRDREQAINSNDNE